MQSFSWMLATLVGAAALLAGCGGEQRLVCVPVQGQMLYNEQPLAEAMVVFHPLGDQLKTAPKPQAQTDSEGKFQLTTLGLNDGAPWGEYAITVELRELIQVGEEATRNGRNLLPAQYAKPESTPLRYTVVRGNNEIPPLRL